MGSIEGIPDGFEVGEDEGIAVGIVFLLQCGKLSTGTGTGTGTGTCTFL